ncbi:MAG: TraB/GumN family protein [Bacteroidota bacterium]
MQRVVGSAVRFPDYAALMPRLFAVLLLLALAAPTLAAQDSTDTPTSDTPLMLWSLADADNTVHLLGSVHFARADFFPLAAPIEAAYDSAEVVVFEIDLAEMQAEAMTMVQRGMFADTTTLADVVSDSLYAQALAATQAAGLPEPAVAKMEPWMLSLTLTSLDLMQKGYGAGIDQHYFERAVADEKRVQALETVAFQLDLFDTMPMDQQVEFLQVTLDGRDETEAMMAGMMTAWMDGDAEALDAFMDENFQDAPDLETALLTDRNAAWVPEIEALLDGTDDAFVVVGAGHLVGDDSVVAMLRAAGYTVTRHTATGG